MNTDSRVPVKHTIGLFAFLNRLLCVAWRIPQLLFYATRGLILIRKDRNMSWGSVLEQTARKFPDNSAIKSYDGNLTYRELNRRANQVAHFLLLKGVIKGDTVTVCIENRPELLVVFCGCAKIGAVCSFINTNQRGDSLVHSFNLNKGKVIFVGEECLPFFNEAAASIDTDGSTVVRIGDPAIRRLPAGEDVANVLAGMPDENPPHTLNNTFKDRLAYIYTSGTTGGLPKAAVIINKRVITSMMWFGRFVWRMKPTDTVYIPLPFFHTNALNVGWPPALYSGSAVAMRRKFSASSFLDDVNRFKATYFIYIGEVCRYLMSQPDRPGQDKTSLRYVIGNGLRPDIWRAFKKRYGIRKVFEFYGAAEGVGVFTNMFNFDCCMGTSITAFAVVQYDVENDCVVRDGRGFATKAPKGEAGLLVMEISNKTPFPGYSDKKKTEEKILRDVFRKGDLWFNSGDLVRNMGFWHTQFVDRLGDTFRWKGENVATMEVEKAIDSFDGVTASAVYGVGIPKGDGKAGMAALKRREGATIDFSALVAHLRSVLPKYAVPLFIRFVDDFQLTATHKIKKAELKNEGYDPTRVRGNLFALLPGSDRYVPLDDAVYREILAGNHKF